jgi:hypothetical protein
LSFLTEEIDLGQHSYNAALSFRATAQSEKLLCDKIDSLIKTGDRHHALYKRALQDGFQSKKTPVAEGATRHCWRKAGECGASAASHSTISTG